MTGIDLRLLRLKYDITQSDLAQALQVSSRTVGRWEHSVKVPELARLAILELSGNDYHQKEGIRP